MVLHGLNGFSSLVEKIKIILSLIIEISLNTFADFIEFKYKISPNSQLLARQTSTYYTTIKAQVKAGFKLQ